MGASHCGAFRTCCHSDQGCYGNCHSSYSLFLQNVLWTTNLFLQMYKWEINSDQSMNIQRILLKQYMSSTSLRKSIGANILQMRLDLQGLNSNSICLFLFKAGPRPFKQQNQKMKASSQASILPLDSSHFSHSDFQSPTIKMYAHK